MYFYFFANAQENNFANTLLKIKVDKIWKLEKQYLLLTKFVNRNSRWKQ